MRKSFDLLRKDALERGMDDLAIVYGWSLMRMGQEQLDAYMQAVRQMRNARA